MTNHYKAMIAALGTIAVWATAFPFSRYVVQYIDPFHLAAVRICIGAIALYLVSLLRGLRKPRGVEWFYFIIAGITGNIGYQILFNMGLQTIPSGTASVLVALTPLMTALLLRVVFKEIMSIQGWIYTFTAFLGVAIVMLWDGIFEVKVGSFLILIIVMMFSVYNVLMRYFGQRGYTALDMTTWSMVMGAILGIPYLPDGFRLIQAMPLEPVALLVYLGLCSSALGYGLWSYALGTADKASDVLNFLYLSPVVATIVSFFMLGEVPNGGLYIGGIVILGSLYLFNKYR